MRTTIKITLLCCICSNVYSKTVCGFDSIDAAAIAGIESVYEKSMSDRIEWGGCVLKNKNEYCFGGQETSNDNNYVDDNCEYGSAARFHTHPPSDRKSRIILTEIFSGNDKRNLKLGGYESIYIGTAGGKILKYDGVDVFKIKNIKNNKKENDDDVENINIQEYKFPFWFIITMSILILYGTKILIFRR